MAKALAAHVDRYISIVEEMAELEKDRLKERAILVAKGAGELVGVTGRRVQIVEPEGRIMLEADNVDKLKKRIGDENFKTLFERVWKPVKNCRAIAERILSGIQFRQLQNLAEKESEPYVRII